MEDTLIGILVVSGIVWIVVALLVGKAGASRKFGFAGAFYASLLLSPILAMLFVLASDKTGSEVITKSDRQSIWIPLVVLGSIAILIAIINEVENQAWEKEYAKQRIIEIEEKRVQDSIFQAQYIKQYGTTDIRTIEELKDKALRVELAKQAALRAKQDAITAELQGRANVAKAKYEAEVAKVTAITERMKEASY